ncbi:MAG: DinB family protein [Bacteroidota bacterium]
MSTLLQFQRRFRYHAWAGACLVEAVSATPVAAACRPLAHLLAADHVWHARLTGAEPRVAIWPDLDAEGCRQLWRETTTRWRTFLDRADLDTTVRYQNSRGIPFETPVADVLDHVLLHAAHHRGQVNTALRAAGAEPPWVDLIAWLREGEPTP